MRRLPLAALLAVLITSPLEAQQARMTAEQREAITAEIRAIVDTIYAAARAIKYDPILAYAASEDGLCVWQARIFSCSEVMTSYKKSWSSTAPDRVVKQEMDSVESRIQVLTPDVAIATRTTQLTRVHRANGTVTPARFASFTVFVRENGRWKQHSAQQASWPIVPPKE